MPTSTLKTRNHHIVAYVAIDARGVHKITDQHHRILGYYDPRTNRTTNQHHKIIGYGCLLAKLIPADLSEDGAGIVQPRKPLTPDQSRREAKRQAEVQQRIYDEQARSSEKVRELRAKLAGN